MLVVKRGGFFDVQQLAAAAVSFFPGFTDEEETCLSTFPVQEKSKTELSSKIKLDLFIEFL